MDDRPEEADDLRDGRDVEGYAVTATTIEWTDYTFNPWWGCTKVSAGCTNCYAETLSNRYGFDAWGPGKPRRAFGKKHWSDPYKWDRKARVEGVRRRVFCASMADVFEDEAPTGERERLWDLVLDTPGLDWQILSKRPEAFRDLLPEDNGWPWRNVWLGVSVEDQATADERIPLLLQTPAAVRFVSYEPALLPVDLRTYVSPGQPWGERFLDWIIVGGESGPGARPFDVEWARLVIGGCRMAQPPVPVFVKQLGARPYQSHWPDKKPLHLRDRKGGDPLEWPSDLRVREFPQ
jgi:protein gp37